mmetsp:Transcript_2749/g.8556  ORF Transcript_2749/g.8556 Transcript_2749/m.8556 type:complete len:261 (+) Transcript_2749:273-1055(+)
MSSSRSMDGREAAITVAPGRAAPGCGSIFPSAMLEGPTFAPTTVPPVVSMAVVTFAAASAACRRSVSRLPSSPCSWSCSFCLPALPVAGPATYLAVCLRVLAGRFSFPSSRLFSPTWSPSRAPLAVCSPLCSSSSSPRCRRFPPALAASSLLSPRFLRRPSPSSSQWVVLSVVPIALVVLPLPASRSSVPRPLVPFANASGWRWVEFGPRSLPPSYFASPDIVPVALITVLHTLSSPPFRAACPPSSRFRTHRPIFSFAS